jgi:penicillin amidase
MDDTRQLRLDKNDGLYLSVNWESEILRSQLITAVGPEKAAALEPEFLYEIPTILPKDIDYSYMGSEALQRVQEARNSLGSGPYDGFGSNNWVVSGQRSKTGKPIFANDMHLGMSAPSIWYENHLAGGSYNLSGITFPGIPGIIAVTTVM